MARDGDGYGTSDARQESVSQYRARWEASSRSGQMCGEKRDGMSGEVSVNGLDWTPQN